MIAEALGLVFIAAGLLGLVFYLDHRCPEDLGRVSPGYLRRIKGQR